MSELKAYRPYANRDGFYHKSEVDKVIAAKDAKILALDAEVAKQKHHAKLFYDERNYAETQLRHSNHKRCLLRSVIAEKDAEIAELKQKLEDAKASHYAESVDMGMENRKLQDELTKLKAQMPEYKKFIEEEEFRKKLVDEYAGYVYDWKGRHYIATPYLNIFIKGILRALWLYRATTAKHLVTAYENYDYLDCQEMTIKQESARTWMTCKLRTAEEWVKVWNNVERKCREKAEEYK